METGGGETFAIDGPVTSLRWSFPMTFWWGMTVIGLGCSLAAAYRKAACRAFDSTGNWPKCQSTGMVS
jgi:hypothetical protein